MIRCLASVALAALAGTSVLVSGCGGGGAPVRVEIGIRYSTFRPSVVHVPSGRPVTVVLRNDDPIDHEWIVGDEALHDRHRRGTEPFHRERPTEVSLEPLTQRETWVRFDEPGRYRYICHLPGHEAYGMVGELIVDPAG